MGLGGAGLTSAALQMLEELLIFTAKWFCL